MTVILDQLPEPRLISCNDLFELVEHSAFHHCIHFWHQLLEPAWMLVNEW